uniref:Leucine-rich repeat-containing N-terminal plant-type domain-containing protein n=1 Tax=Oryza barthii TaxID=65489 RepID=A0A0D3HN36_9ORYZ
MSPLTAMFLSGPCHHHQSTTTVLLLLTPAAATALQVMMTQLRRLLPRRDGRAVGVQGRHRRRHDRPPRVMAAGRWPRLLPVDRRPLQRPHGPGHIVKLNLGSRESINPFAMRLFGKISHSLLSLHHLQHLDLSHNSLEGPTGDMPEFLGSLKSLRYLNLSGIPFHGLVPPHLGNLSNLRVLDLSYTANSYSPDISWVTRLRRLRYLNMGDVNLIAWVLDLTGCDLATANQWLPHLNMTNLEELQLSFNKFNHTITSCWFWNIKTLKNLNLRSTYLYGRIPDHAIGNLTSLEVLDFSGLVDAMENHYRGIMVANMTNLCNLRILDLTSSLSHGNILEILERLPQCTPWNRLNELHLGSNNISGKLPDRIGKFAGIVKLDLSNNRLTGFLPSEIGMLTNLTTIDLSLNYMDGFITEENFGSLTNLKYIWLRGNSMKIVFDSKWLPPFSLTYADFSFCQLGPSFPAWLQSQVDIVELDISSTAIVDVLPDWFWTTISKATYLDIGNNTIRGKLPANMETMSVNFLSMRSNQFSGGIPRLPRNLTILDISKNNLSGLLPQKFGAPSMQVLELSFNNFTDVQMLAVVDLSRNNFSGKLPMWVGDLTELQFLRLSYNLFSGNIPPSITNLRNLYVLDLASNSLSGGLPLSLSNLTAMTTSYGRYDQYDGVDHKGYLPVVTKHQELYYGYTRFPIGSIDLSSNQLSGVLPEGIASLDALRNLNLSWNHLSGRIPDKLGIIKLLESLDLSRNMFSGEIPQSLSNLTSLSLLFKKAWRVAFFDLCDKLYDKTYVLVAVSWARFTRKAAAN